MTGRHWRHRRRRPTAERATIVAGLIVLAFIAAVTVGPVVVELVREFKRLLPMLRGTQQLIQQDFFAPLQGSLTELVNDALVAAQWRRR